MTVFHSFLVDDEEYHTKFATNAYNKLLKDVQTKEPTENIERLLKYKFSSSVSGKRSRIQREKLKESLEQDVTLSPKKKKTNSKDVSLKKSHSEEKTAATQNPKETTPAAKKKGKKV